MEPDRPFWRFGNPVIWGVAASAVIVLAALWLSLQAACVSDANGVSNCKTKLAYLVDAPPNEVGDTLAGVAGVLAFIWIIVTVAMQADELRAQRKELNLTRKELRLAREAQEKLVEAAQIQADIFKGEKTFRDQSLANSKVEALVDLIVSLARDERFGRSKWRLEKRIDANNSTQRAVGIVQSIQSFLRISDRAILMRNLAENLNATRERIDSLLSEGHALALAPNIRETLSKILDASAEIIALSEKVSPADRVRINALNLTQLQVSILEVVNQPEYWSPRVEGDGD